MRKGKLAKVESRLVEIANREAVLQREVEVGERLGRCLIRPDQKWKMIWDFWISLLVLSSALYTPWRLAFMEEA